MSKNIHATQNWVRDNIGIKNTASGELISLPDSAEAPISSMKIFGKTKQFTTTGKNLFDVSKVVEKSSGSAGDVTVNPDDSITVTVYTATNSTSVGVLGTLAPQLVVGETYTLNAETDSPNKYVYLKGSSESWYFGKSRTIKETDLTDSVLFYPNDYESSATFRKIQIEKGSAPTEYEPYTGGIPSPNPDYPQELESVGESVNINVYGKNLFNVYAVPSTTSTTAGVYNNNDGTLTVKASANSTGVTVSKTLSSIAPGLKVGHKYTLTLTTTAATQNRIYLTTAKTVWRNETSLIVTDDVLNSNITFYAEKVGGTVTISNIQIEAGSVATEYEPYKEQSFTLSTPDGLSGIPVSSGGNYTDENGQQYICDEIDLNRGVRIQRIDEYVFTGEEEYALMAGGTAADITLPVEGAANNTLTILTHLTKIYTWYMDPSPECRITVTYEGDTYSDVKDIFTTNYANGTPVRMKYILAEPIETPLTEEELQAYKAPQANYPNTTFYNNDGAVVEVEYVADTKNYIDNKFAELQANILSIAK